MRKLLKIGISMRSISASTYLEVRDAIARDWSVYMQNVFPNDLWMFIPNIGNNVNKYIERWGINAIILSGGEDYGSDPMRDLTERNLYNYAIDNNIPLLGVCRGLQLICKMNGFDSLSGVNIEKHLATSHEVFFLNQNLKVNSFHSNIISKTNMLNDIFDHVGFADDETVEAVYKRNLMGIMWHPERINANQQEVDLIVKNFLYGAN
jgi:N5-(cytidine 5'-diphosphoramidyl)-L-glutamine hydrolase